MSNGNNKKLIFITYDGIKNSVFQSQLLQPILNSLKENNNIEITLVSFEKTRPSNKFLRDTIPAHDRLHLVLCRRLPFLGKGTLIPASYQLKKLLKIMPTEKIIARGPLAGLVVQKTLNSMEKEISKNISLTIQARGLCAEEYRFTSQHLKKSLFKKYIRRFIYNQLNKIELQAYQTNKKLNPFLNINIEAVSPALKEYLITNFDSNAKKISIATRDIPQNIHKDEILKRRHEVRSELGIAQDRLVFCYNGSFKPWQGVPQIIEYSRNQYNKNPKSFLLILTLDKKQFQKKLSSSGVPNSAYKVMTVKPDQLYKYLSAADAGLLFRDKDIINWVSRPTKMLEYQATGLKVIHNNTIAWLEHPNQNHAARQI